MQVEVNKNQEGQKMKDERARGKGIWKWVEGKNVGENSQQKEKNT